MMKEKLQRIENQLQYFIERRAVQVLGLPDVEANLARRLVQAMQVEIRQDESGHPVAPNIYTLNVHPKYAADLQQNQALIQTLSGDLRRAMHKAGLQFESEVSINIFPDEKVEEGTFKVHAMWKYPDIAETQGVASGEPDPAVSNIPPKAFLIVGGSKIFALDKEVINIGRKLDNQLVLDDPRVSRTHSQLRAIKGQFMIFDLQSSGGTYVNGEPVTQAELKPGDVISLAGVPMVYGQDAVRPIDKGLEYQPPDDTDEHTTSSIHLDELDLDTFEN